MGVRPDIVFSGHGHNYQRFAKHYPDGTFYPTLLLVKVAFDELDSVASTDDQRFTFEQPELGVKLNSFCDSRHEFLGYRLQEIIPG
jgi:hypothetical protein